MMRLSWLRSAPSLRPRVRVWQRPTWVSDDLQRSEVRGRLVWGVRPLKTKPMLSFRWYKRSRTHLRTFNKEVWESCMNHYTESHPTFSKLFFEHKFWIHNMSGSDPLIHDSEDFSNGQKLILGNSRSSNSSLSISTRTGSLRKCFRLGAPKKIMKRDNNTITKKSLLVFLVLMARLALQICIQ